MLFVQIRDASSAATRMHKMAFWMAYFIFDMTYFEILRRSEYPQRVNIHPSKFIFSSACPFKFFISFYLKKYTSTYTYARILA